MGIQQKIRWEYDSKSLAWITAKHGTDTTVYVQSTLDKRPFAATVRLFTEHCKLSLGVFIRQIFYPFITDLSLT